MAEDSDSDQELFPIDESQFQATFVYEDPLLVTGVLRAVVEGNLEKVKKLVQEGRSANINDNHGNTSLHVAVIRDLPDIVDYLLTLEVVNVNSRNFYGETSLFYAVKAGNLLLVEKLIKANANVNLSKFEDITPLHVSVKYPEIARLLIENGAKTDALDYSGETPLHEAVQERSIETVCMLLYYNADPNVQCDNGITPFMKAVILESLELQEILLDYVTDFNTATKDGMTVLNLALTHDTCPYVEEIILRGADINYEHCALNAFIMCLRVPNVNNFTLIWKDFRYQKLYNGRSFLELIVQNLNNPEIKTYLRIIIESENLAPIFEDFDFRPFYNFVMERIRNKHKWYHLTAELLCLYLCHGYVLNRDVIYELFELFGYSELLFLCLHMDIKDDEEAISISISSIFYDPKLSIEKFKKLVAKYIEESVIPVKQFLPYLRIVGISRSDRTEISTVEYEQLTQFPSLLELSRNSARDYLVQKFQLFTSKQYYFFVQNLPIPSVYKDFLMFKKPVYNVIKC